METIEELQKLLLEKEQELETVRTSLGTLNNDFEELKKSNEQLTNSLNQSREINSQLALKISAQTLTPKDEPKESAPSEVLTFDDILKNL